MISEIVICTNTKAAYDIIEQINYYNILGFDKITIVDNGSPLFLYHVANLYKNVTYIKNTYYLNQYEMYLKLYKESTADWIFFSDDDEFLWFDLNKYANINDFITKKSEELNTNNIAIRWVKINNYNGIKNRDFKNENHSQVKLFKYINPEYEIDSWVKSIFKTKQDIDFRYIHFCYPLNNTKTIQGKTFQIESGDLIAKNYIYKYDDCLLYHYYFRTYEEFLPKIKYFKLSELSFNDFCAIIYKQNYILETNNIYSILYDN